MVEDGGVVGRRTSGVRVVVVIAVSAASAARTVGRTGPAVTQMSDLAGRAVGDEPAVLQEDRPLDDVGELTHLVQNRHQGQPLRAQPPEDLGQGLTAGTVDAGQGLIEDEQLWGAHQGPGDEDALGLPAGEDLDVVRGPVGQPDGVQGGHGLALGGPAPIGPGTARPQEPGAHHLQGGGRDA